MSEMLDLRYLLALAVQTLRHPRAGAAAVLRLAPPTEALWLAFALVIVGSLILGEMVAMILDLPQNGTLTGQPMVVTGLIQAAALYLMIQAIAHIGRFFGGMGQVEDALALVTWLQFLFLFVQAAQLVLILVAPILASITTILVLALFFWLLVNFIAEMHGFQSLARVFFGTLVTAFTILFTLSVILGLLGLGLSTEAQSV